MNASPNAKLHPVPSLAKIRNASRAKHATVEVRRSRAAERLLEVLRREGFIGAFKPVGEEPSARRWRVYLKYVNKKDAAIEQLVRVSRPGMRVYNRSTRLPRVRQGTGVAILSTSLGLMSDREAKRKRVGGEVLCYVW